MKLKQNKKKGKLPAYFFPFLLKSLINISSAIVIDGAFGEGAVISSLKPASSAAFAVFSPQEAILVLFCWKSVKF